MRIAILEDDPQQLHMMEQMVHSMGHTCVGYPTGAQLMKELRRAYPASTEEVQQFGPYRLDRTTLTVHFGEEAIALTHREFSLALLLFQNPGRLMSRDYLREAIWGQNAEVLSRTLDTHISRLRQQLQLRPGAQYAITAVYGLGYRLDSQTEGVTV